MTRFTDYALYPGVHHNSGVPPYRCPEHQADVSAMAMLMPAKKVIGLLKDWHEGGRQGAITKRMAIYFAVPEAAARIRFVNLIDELWPEIEEIERAAAIIKPGTGRHL